MIFLPILKAFQNELINFSSVVAYNLATRDKARKYESNPSYYMYINNCWNVSLIYFLKLNYSDYVFCNLFVLHCVLYWICICKIKVRFQFLFFQAINEVGVFLVPGLAVPQIFWSCTLTTRNWWTLSKHNKQ